MKAKITTGEKFRFLVGNVLDHAIALRVSPIPRSFCVFKLNKLCQAQFMFGSLRALCRRRRSKKKARTQSLLCDSWFVRTRTLHKHFGGVRCFGQFLFWC